MQDSSSSRDARYAAFGHQAFLLYWTSRLLLNFSISIVAVAVGWQIYDLTRNPFDLGLVGIIQFAPALLLILFTGAAADRFGRRRIMVLAAMVETACTLALLILTLRGVTQLMPIFLTLALFGVARAFMNPASTSLVANLVPPADFANAVAWNSSAKQLATIVGPATGGLLYGLGAPVPYAVSLLLMIGATMLAMAIPKPAQKRETDQPTLQTLFAGFRYIWKEKVVLGAISLDMFAVLLGGATALLPVYARDILELGPWGLGLLRSAPGIGALCVAMWLAAHPIRNHAGLLMFVFVGMFGMFTLVFGLSLLPWLSIAALALLGAADMVSVYIRHTLIQLWTPDRLRGRVSAVNSVFIGASNELGEFRAGTMAAFIGTVPAVVIGGLGTIGVAVLWAWMFPALRRTRRLDGRA